MCDAITMDWVRMYVQQELTAIRAEFARPIDEADAMGGLRAEVAMLSAELAAYRDTLPILPPLPTIVEEIIPPSEPIEEAIENVLEEHESVEEHIDEAVTEAIAEILESPTEEQIEDEGLIAVVPGADTSIPRTPWYERPLFGSKAK